MNYFSPSNVSTRLVPVRCMKKRPSLHGAQFVERDVTGYFEPFVEEQSSQFFEEQVDWAPSLLAVICDSLPEEFYLTHVCS